MLKEINEKVAELVANNDGYCPCAIERSEDTFCPCKEIRESKIGTICHCGRYQVEDEPLYGAEIAEIDLLLDNARILDLEYCFVSVSTLQMALRCIQKVAKWESED